MAPKGGCPPATQYLEQLPGAVRGEHSTGSCKAATTGSPFVRSGSDCGTGPRFRCDDSGNITTD